MDKKLLFSPGKIGKLEIKNRGVMTAMGVGLGKENGMASDKTVAYFKERAAGEIGLIITEYTRVNEKDGIVSGKQLSMATDKHIEPLKKVTAAVHEYGTKFFVQLHHPGRQNIAVFPGLWPMGNKLAKVIPSYWRLFYKVMSKQDRSSANDPKMIKMMHRFMPPLKAPSAVPSGIGFSPFGNQLVEALTIDEIKKLEGQFVDAAERAQKAGADGVEIHAGHGYLLNQFTSPYSNIREDAYGGSVENRVRIIAEIIQGIKARCGDDFPISVRLTVDEFYEKIGYPKTGITLPEGVLLAKEVERVGADALNVTIATADTQVLISEPVSYEPGWRQYLVKAIKEAVSIPIIAVGVIRTPNQAEEILASGTQDFIGLARPMLADPQWMKKAQENRDEEISRCISCLACQQSYERGMTTGEHAICAVNPRMGFETDYDLYGEKNGRGRKVIVIGAGPAGLTAARELALRDFVVVLYEAADEVGGQVNLAKQPPHKDKIAWSVIDLKAQAKKAGVLIKYGVKVSADFIKEQNPYAVFIATGASAVHPRIPGADQKNVYTTTPILKGEVTIQNQKVVVVGSGMTGLETAELLSEQGNQVTIIEMADKIAPGGFEPNVWDVTQRLEENQVQLKPDRRLLEIKPDTVITSRPNNVREIWEADTVVLSLGVRSDNQLSEELKELQHVYTVGDASKIGRIAEAVASGFRTARMLN